VFNIIN